MSWLKALAVALCLLLGATPGWAQSCTAKAFGRLPAGVAVDRMESVAANAPWKSWDGKDGARQPVPFCRVVGRIRTVVGFELWLPARAAWTGRFLSTGVGGEAGTFNYADMARGVRRGFAAASTDTGHKLGDDDWASGAPAKRRYFAATANHLLAVDAKALIARFYGGAIARSYFVGCSGGGREGLKEVQAYPDDFDGVLAGGAGPDQLAVSMRLLWSQYVMAPRYASLIDDKVSALVSKAAIESCDMLDGVRDGVIADPMRCTFDPSSLQCGLKAGECLSAQQVAVLRELYAPLRDGQGHAIDQGVLPGVRLTFAPRSAFAFSLFGRVVHRDPHWDPARLDIGRDLAAARRAWPDLPNDKDDLSRFKARGGKLLYYHGWMDPWILAQLPIAYYRSVGRRDPGRDDYFRLFMVPGMGHCRGGPATDVFGGAGDDGVSTDPAHDMLSALVAWVEQHRAPQSFVAAHRENGKVTQTRPLCLYPARAAYAGSGSTDDAANFSCTIDKGTRLQ